MADGLTQRLTRLAAIVVIGMMGAVQRGWAAPPLLYHQAAYESPVRGDPDDLLLIAGYGFSGDDQVIYQAVNEGGGTVHPSEPPWESTADRGIADVVSYLNVPYSLTVRLPKTMRTKQTYELWVRTARGEWSDAVKINDARPLWFSPAFVYASQSVASLRRYVKVVGRNLEPMPDGITEVRLSGKTTLTLKAEPAPADAAALDYYVAFAYLPARLIPGSYRIQVRRGRSEWVEVPGQALEVRPDPAHKPEFDVSEPRFGGCKADDGRDDVGCVVRAIAAADAAGGGTVIFGPGIWNLSELSMAQPDGIVIPRGVNLRGAGKRVTTVIQNADGKPSAVTATFTLLGNSSVEGMTFRDAHVYSTEYVNSAFLRLGRVPGEGKAIPVDDIVITQNAFDRPNVAISDSGSPITRLFVTKNEFGAYRSALELAGNRNRVNDRFGLEDSVIADNIFKPGSYLEPDIRQGTIASEIGASLRVDFSRNTADGAATDSLYSPEDAHGWRAAFFWHMNNNQEMMLVSQNIATCTGDKAGDGEAISFDNNANTFGLAHAGTVLAADSGSITVQGPLAARQNDRDIRIANYYDGHWIQMGEGPGLGQVRKIVSYVEEPLHGTVTFRIAPDWDVVPAAGQTRINVGREYWQVITVANTVDHRQPLCRKSNRTSKKGGGISVWAQIADSVVEANRQYDTDGITFQQYYNEEEASCTECRRETFYVNFLEIRGNLIDGEYAWDDDCSTSGIFGSIAAGPTRSPPSTVSYGLSVSHNTIDRADGRRGGAISLMPTWYEGPPPNRWPLVNNALIYQNTLRGFDAAQARPCMKEQAHPRTGISLGASSLVWNSVLYANSCLSARRPLDIREHAVVRVCLPGTQATCECTPR
jgi:hypothetical protein